MAAFQGRPATLLGVAKTATDARILLEALEIGTDGVVLRTNNPAEVSLSSSSSKPIVFPDNLFTRLSSHQCTAVWWRRWRYMDNSKPRFLQVRQAIRYLKETSQLAKHSLELRPAVVKRIIQLGMGDRQVSFLFIRPHMPQTTCLVNFPPKCKQKL